MKISRPWSIWTGIAIAAFLLISYFVKLEVEGGSNYYVQDSLLGIIIFHNIYPLSLYILIAMFFIALGISVKEK